MGIAAIRIMLVDDHAVVREGMRALLEAFEEMSVVGEAANGDAAIEALPRIRPDLLMSDLKMPGMPAAELIRRARIVQPGLRVLAFTSFAEARHVRELIEAGADGYLLKDANKDEIRRAINTVITGVRYLHPAAQQAIDEAGGSGPLGTLTLRERDVLRELAKGRSNKEIGRILELTEGTVKGYVSAIFEKIGVNDRTQAALYAHRIGVVGD
ncbi:MAG: response regulator transcription factor [Ahniella sp.]|nr:response regulator transcription factor [Ahniella sp.]